MKIRVFISSLQKELADERLALQILLTTDPFLSQHCVPILFENHPAPLRPNAQAYLELLDSCHIYVGMVWKEYGRPFNGLSATHHEYRRALARSMAMLIAVKGPGTLDRESETESFLKEIKRDGHTYERFESIEELQKKIRARLIRHINDHYHVEPTAEQENVAMQTIHVASAFERQRLDLTPWEKMDKSIAAEIAARAEEKPVSQLTEEDVRTTLWLRGYLWKDEKNSYWGTAAGILLFAKDPSAIFPHVRIQLAAFGGIERTHNPLDHQTVRKPIPSAIDETVAFIRRNTRHPLRVAGLKRIELDEYPEEAIREALVNALAHRSYEDAGRRVTVDLFRDRIEIVSPGVLPQGLTLTRLRSGQARPRSRNPVIAQGLTLLDRMEERGTGIQRMNAAMLNHGLDKPQINIVENEVVVTLPGPGEDLDRLLIPAAVAPGLSPAIEERLNDRQRAILEHALSDGQVTSGWVTDKFGVVKDTAVRDLNELCEMSLLEKKGKGRGVRYVLKTQE